MAKRKTVDVVHICYFSGDAYRPTVACARFRNGEHVRCRKSRQLHGSWGGLVPCECALSMHVEPSEAAA